MRRAIDLAPVESETEHPTREPVLPGSVRVIRVGHGGNCSSVGSVIDTLFLGAAAGGAILAAICAAMQDEEITVVDDAHVAPRAPRENDDR